MSKPVNAQNLTAAETFVRQLLIDRGLVQVIDGRPRDVNSGKDAKGLELPLVRLMLERGWKWEAQAELEWLDRNWARMVAFPDNPNYLHDFVVGNIVTPTVDIPSDLRAARAVIGETFGTLRGRLPRLRRIIEILTRHELVRIAATGVYYDRHTNLNVDDLVAILHVMPWQWDSPADEEYLVRNWIEMVKGVREDFQGIAFFLIRFAARSRMDIPTDEWAKKV